MLSFTWALVFKYCIRIFRNNTSNILHCVESAIINLHSTLKRYQTNSYSTISEDVPPLNRISSHDHFGSTKRRSNLKQMQICSSAGATDVYRKNMKKQNNC